MATLDNNLEIPNPNEVPFTNTVIRYGLIGGGLAIAFGLVAQLTG